jgi:NADH:ubiquinone oxidoreductase subunit K
MIPLSWYLTFAAILFCVGLYGVLVRKNAIAILMSIELMLNSVIINLISFWRYRAPEGISGQAFAIVVFAVAAAEVSVGLALIISIYRRRKSVVAEDMNLMKW